MPPQEVGRRRSQVNSQGPLGIMQRRSKTKAVASLSLSLALFRPPSLLSSEESPYSVGLVGRHHIGMKGKMRWMEVVVGRENEKMGDSYHVPHLPRVRFFKLGLRVCGLSNLFENDIHSLPTVNLSPQSVP